MLSDKFPRDAFPACLYLLRSTGYDYSSSVFSSSRSHVYDIVGVADYIQIVFYDNDCRPVVDETLEYLQKGLDIRRMEPYGRLVEHEYRILLPAPHLAGELEPLGFAS